nr:hypothetical protein [Staphylococcus aureus]
MFESFVCEGEGDGVESEEDVEDKVFDDGENVYEKEESVGDEIIVV